MQKGQDGNEKERSDCAQTDVRAFGIVRDWKAMSLEAEVWVETVTECGRRFMAGRGKKR